MSRVLIVEDEGWLAFDMQDWVESDMGLSAIAVPGVHRAMEVVEQGVDFAFLDVNVVDGVTFDLARILLGRNIPFAFVSGVTIYEIPPDLKVVPFIMKPASHKQMESILVKGLKNAVCPSPRCVVE
jgi:DNA-binding LytR/AlgR family response regulator